MKPITQRYYSLDIECINIHLHSLTRLYSVVANYSQVQLYFIFNFITAPLHGVTTPSGPGPRECRGFIITLKQTTLGTVPLDQGPLPDNKQHSQDTAMPSVGFGPAIPASERPQTGIEYHSPILLCFPGLIQLAHMMPHCPNIHSHPQDNFPKFSYKSKV